MTRALALVLVLSGGAARARDGGAPEGEGLVLEVASGVVTVPSGAVRSIDAGVYLDEAAAVRAARELAALRAEAAALRRQAPPAAPGALVLLAVVCLAGGFAAGLLVR